MRGKMKNPDQSKLMRLISDYSTLCWQEGVQVGHVAAGNNLIEDAGQKFSIGMDELAQTMREMGRRIHKQVKESEQTEKPKRDKRKGELYKEILGQLESMVEVDREADLDVDKLVTEIRNRRNG